MRFLLLGCLLLAGILGCGSAGPAAKSPTNVPSPRPVSAPAAGLSGDDGLWAMAPADTVLGFVAKPGTTETLYDVSLAVLRLMDARPAGALFARQLRKRLSILKFDGADVDLLKKTTGVDLRLGLGFFMSESKEMTAVLPIGDLKVFRSVVSGHVVEIEGLKYDVYDDDQLACTQRGKFYLCRRTIEALLRLTRELDVPSRQGADHPGKSRFLTAVSKLPDLYMGDIAMVIDMPWLERRGDFNGATLRELLDESRLMIVSARLAGGSATVRVWMQGHPRGDAGAILKASQALGALSTTVTALRPSSLMRLIFPVEKLLGRVPSNTSVLGGLDLKNDVLAKLSGEIVAFSSSSTKPWGRLSLGITDPEVFEKVLRAGCPVIPILTGGRLTTTWAAERCDLTLDLSGDPLWTSALDWTDSLALSIGVGPRAVSLAIGEEGSPMPEVSTSAIGQELLDREWNYSLWAQNFSIITGLGESWRPVIDSLAPAQRENAALGLWMLAQISEFGVAMSFQPDGLHLMLHLSTYAADDSQAYSAYLAAVAKNIDGGNARAEFSAIAQKWPRSRAALSFRAINPISILGATVLSRRFPAAMRLVDTLLNQSEQSITGAPVQSTPESHLPPR